MSPEDERQLRSYLGRDLEVVVDRPIGSQHPKAQLRLRYSINYGFLPGTCAPDGDPQDAYIVGIGEPVDRYFGHVIAIIIRDDDREGKLVVAPIGTSLTQQEIGDALSFQECYFQSRLIMEASDL
jgi:inorganic pyrophosphatase